LLHLQVGKVLPNARLLRGQRALLGGKVAVLLGGLLVDVGSGLAKLSLVDAQLTEALSCCNLLLCKVAVQAGSRLPKLGLLRSLLTNGLADVGQLPRGCLAKLRALRGKLTQLRTSLQAKLTLLQRRLRGLLAKSSLSLSLLAVKLTNPRQQL